MNIEDMIRIAPKLIPLIPRLEKAVATAQRLRTDPDIIDMLAVAKEAAALIEEAEKPTPPAPAPRDV